MSLFEFKLDYQLIRLRFCVVFPTFSRQIPGYYLEIRTGRFTPDPYLLTIHNFPLISFDATK